MSRTRQTLSPTSRYWQRNKDACGRRAWAHYHYVAARPASYKWMSSAVVPPSMQRVLCAYYLNPNATQPTSVLLRFFTDAPLSTGKRSTARQGEYAVAKLPCSTNFPMSSWRDCHDCDVALFFPVFFCSCPDRSVERSDPPVTRTALRTLTAIKTRQQPEHTDGVKALSNVF